MRNNTTRKYQLIGWSFLMGIILILNTPFYSLADEEYRFERMWPTLQQPWYFKSPMGIAIDRNGYVFITEVGQHRIQKFTSDGTLVGKWGNKGSGEGEFIRPRSIAVDGNGFVYVVDSGNNRIQKFTPHGQFVTTWGRYGGGNGEFFIPKGIAIDKDDYVYIVDSFNNRIQKFTSEGQFVNKWGSEGYGNEGDGDGELHWPAGIAIDGNGYVYVVDSFNHRIQKFTADGQFVAAWGTEGSGDGEFSYPEGIAVDENGYVYTFETSRYSIENHRIQKFTSDGRFVTKWGTLGGGEGEFGNEAGAVAVDRYGLVYVADVSNYRIQKFTPDGRFVARWGSEGCRSGEFFQPLDIAREENGSIYVTDSLNHRIQKFTPDGRFLIEWGSPGSGDGEFFVPWGIAVDKNGFIYVTDHHNNRIQKFTSEGRFVTKWGSDGWGNEGSGEGEFYWPQGIAVDDDGYVYVVDTYNHRIQKFTSDGRFVDKWGGEGAGYGGSGTEDGEFWYPEGIAVDNNGHIYVADEWNNRIQKFTAAGEFVSAWGWGSLGSGDGQFDYACGVAVDENGYVYVADTYNHRIQKFTSDGRFIAKWGSLGSEPGDLSNPHGLVVDSSGQIFVCDTGHNRIQLFKEVSIASNNKAIIVAGGGPYQGNHLWDATQMCASFAYRTLTYQGFIKENIYYLTSDTDLDLDGNGVLDDVDGDATNSNLQQAITNWASDADDVILYLTDHGGNGTFRMSETETLSASELDSRLDGIQETISGKVIVIYDACESGSFLSALTPSSGKERIIISSTSPGESAYFVSQGSISFSNYFWTHVFNGLTIYDAFSLAREAISYTTGYQNPLLDDNGNGIGNEAGDGELARSTYIGNGTIIYGEAPVIEIVSPDQTISQTNEALLYADNVTDADGIARLWAVIRPPDYSQSNPDNPVQELPSLDLMPIGGDRYEAVYDGFNIPGTYQIAIYARDRIGNTSVPKLTTVSVNNPLTRKAIIVAGGSQTDELWPAIEKNVVLAYEALTYQGYSDDDIYFMSPVTISTGVDGTPTLSNLSYSITTWATNNTQDVVIYLIGNGYDGNFEISELETLSAADLDEWIDSLQDAIPGKVTLIYEACRSGSFLPLLTPPTGKERILLSSTGEDQPACFLSEGNISFSHYFWRQVLNGEDIRDAFIHAKQAISFSCQGQTPNLDDNGNGVGNERGDGRLAGNYTIGVGIMLAGDAPIIGSISPPQNLYGDTSANIRVEDVTTTGAIEKVWAVITPPDYITSQPSDPVIDLPTFELNQAGNNRYEGFYGNFSAAGTYEIAVYAMDNNGNVSLPRGTGVSFTPIPSLNVSRVETDLTGPVALGQDIKITITANGHIPSLYYQYWLTSGYHTQNFGNRQMLKNWSADKTLIWSPENNDHYIIVAYVTNDTSSNNYHQAGLSIETEGNSVNPVQITEFTSTINYPQSSETAITLNTTATGGSGALYYRYWQCKGIRERVSLIRDYSTSSSCIWTPPEDGLYTVVVWVTDDPTGNDYCIAGITCTIGQ